MVNLGLFCPFYNDMLWQYSTLHPSNNINNLPLITKDQVYPFKKKKNSNIINNGIINFLIIKKIHTSI